jgi:ligand-binding sensor domain-containing protein
MKKIFLFLVFLPVGGWLMAQKAPALAETYLNRTITCMVADDSVLWIGTSNGLLQYNIRKGTSTVVNKFPLTIFTGIASIKLDNKGNKWIMTLNDNLIKYSSAGAQRIPWPANMPQDAQIYTRKDLAYMLCHENYQQKSYLAVYQNGNWVEKKDNLLNNSKFQCVDESGNLWFLEVSSGDLYKYDLTKWTNYGQDGGTSWIGKDSYYSLNSVVEVPEKKEIHMIGGFLYFSRIMVDNVDSWIDRYEMGFGYDVPGLFYRKLVIDKNKYPWIGTDAGLLYEESDGWKHKAGLDVVDMCFTEDNQLLMLTADYDYSPDDKGLFFASVQLNKPDSAEKLLSGIELMSDFVYHKKSLYVHSDKIIYKITGGKVDTIDLLGPAVTTINDVLFDKKSGMTLVASGEGIYQAKNKQLNKLPLVDAKSDDWFHNNGFSDLEVHNGRVYASIGFNNNSYYSDGPSPYVEGGLAYMDKGTVNFLYGVNDQIKDGDKLCSCDSMLWMYSDEHKHLLYYYHLSPENIADSVTGMPTDDQILSLACKRDSGIYVVFPNGILLLSETGRKEYFKDSIPALKDIIINGGQYDARGRLWIISADGSLARLSGSKWTSIPAPESQMYVADFTLDSYNRVWLACGNGIFMYDGTKWNNVSKNLKLPESNYGLIRYANNKIYTYLLDTGLIVLTIN